MGSHAQSLNRNDREECAELGIRSGKHELMHVYRLGHLGSIQRDDRKPQGETFVSGQKTIGYRPAAEVD